VSKRPFFFYEICLSLWSSYGFHAPPQYFFYPVARLDPNGNSRYCNRVIQSPLSITPTRLSAACSASRRPTFSQFIGRGEMSSFLPMMPSPIHVARSLFTGQITRHCFSHPSNTLKWSFVIFFRSIPGRAEDSSVFSSPSRRFHFAPIPRFLSFASFQSLAFFFFSAESSFFRALFRAVELIGGGIAFISSMTVRLISPGVPLSCIFDHIAFFTPALFCCFSLLISPIFLVDLNRFKSTVA